MKNPLSPEAALGTVVLLVSVPIVGALLYIFGVSIADVVARPTHYPLVLAWLGCVIFGLVIGLILRSLRGQHANKGMTE